MHFQIRIIQVVAGWLRRWGRARRVDTVGAVLHAARATIRRKRFCVLTTLGVDGADARVLQPFPAEADFTVWFGTSIVSRKIAQLRADPRATLVYEDDRRGACVVLVGRAHIVDDLDERRRRFMPAWWTFFPEGPDGDDYALIRFAPERLEVWDAARRITPEPFGLRAARLLRHGDRWAFV